jgi:hypothetical protein
MSIKHLIAAALLSCFSVPTLAFFGYFFRIDEAKYLPGDCITPTDQSLSFYGHYARVTGILSFESTLEPGAYYLYFPVYEARTPLHPQSIDQQTRRVDHDFCERQQGSSQPATARLGEK